MELSAKEFLLVQMEEFLMKKKTNVFAQIKLTGIRTIIIAKLITVLEEEFGITKNQNVSVKMVTILMINFVLFV